VAPYRTAAGRRTVFNLAGPLANPCRPVRQIVGVTNAGTARVVAGALERLGSERACVVWGEPGIDEFSVTGASTWLQVGGGPARSGTLAALHGGRAHGDLPGGDAAENAAIFQRLLAGDETGPLRDMVALNAGVAIDCWHDRAPELGGAGYRQALTLLASGAVRERFARHLELARALGAAAAQPG
jgi:anthranilate phosphoribosyltransferase